MMFHNFEDLGTTVSAYKIFYRINDIEYGIYNSYQSFIRTFKIITLHFVVWRKCVFYTCYHIALFPLYLN